MSARSEGERRDGNMVASGNLGISTYTSDRYNGEFLISLRWKEKGFSRPRLFLVSDGPSGTLHAREWEGAPCGKRVSRFITCGELNGGASSGWLRRRHEWMNVWDEMDDG